jgi:hypothetical protein
MYTMGLVINKLRLLPYLTMVIIIQVWLSHKIQPSLLLGLKKMIIVLNIEYTILAQLEKLTRKQ